MGEKKQAPLERLAAVLSNVDQRAAALGREALAELTAALEQARRDAAEYRRAMHEISTQRDAAVVRAEAAEEELASLRPSGQVAEMLGELSSCLIHTGECRDNGGPDCTCALTHLPTLAAKAQGYEAAVEERDKAWSERATTIAEKHSAVADNAALLEALDGATQLLAEYDAAGAESIDSHIDVTDKNAHPGAALLEEHRKTTEALEACREHVRQTGEKHRKALVRARNEGLEKAAVLKDYHAQQHERRARRKTTRDPGAWALRAKAARADAAVFRAMKEREQ
jgi:chromosome segregation ATPase